MGGAITQSWWQAHTDAAAHARTRPRTNTRTRKDTHTHTHTNTHTNTHTHTRARQHAYLETWTRRTLLGRRALAAARCEAGPRCNSRQHHRLHGRLESAARFGPVVPSGPLLAPNYSCKIETRHSCSRTPARVLSAGRLKITPSFEKARPHTAELVCVVWRAPNFKIEHNFNASPLRGGGLVPVV